MPATEADEVVDVLARVSTWPAAKRLALARELALTRLWLPRVAASFLRQPWGAIAESLLYPEGVALDMDAVCVAITSWLSLYQISSYTSFSQPRNCVPFLAT